MYISMVTYSMSVYNRVMSVYNRVMSKHMGDINHAPACMGTYLKQCILAN